MGQNDTTTRTAASESDFDAVLGRLREILEPLRPRLSVTKDGPDGVVMEIPGLEARPWGTSPASAAASATCRST